MHFLASTSNTRPTTPTASSGVEKKLQTLGRFFQESNGVTSRYCLTFPFMRDDFLRSLNTLKDYSRFNKLSPYKICSIANISSATTYKMREASWIPSDKTLSKLLFSIGPNRIEHAAFIDQTLPMRFPNSGLCETLGKMERQDFEGYFDVHPIDNPDANYDGQWNGFVLESDQRNSTFRVAPDPRRYDVISEALLTGDPMLINLLLSGLAPFPSQVYYSGFYQVPVPSAEGFSCVTLFSCSVRLENQTLCFYKIVSIANSETARQNAVCYEYFYQLRELFGSKTDEPSRVYTQFLPAICEKFGL